MDHGYRTGIQGSGKESDSTEAQVSKERRKIPAVHRSGQEQKNSQLIKLPKIAVPARPQLTPRARDYTADQLNADGDAYIESKFDTAGERKVDLDGHLKDGREYRCRTFHVLNRADRLFMLPEDCYGVLKDNHSEFMFFWGQSIYGLTANQKEKDNLIKQEILPQSSRERQVTIVTARSVFRQFGHEIVISGRSGWDDYWDDYQEAILREKGIKKIDRADQKRQSGGMRIVNPLSTALSIGSKNVEKGFIRGRDVSYYDNRKLKSQSQTGKAYQDAGLSLKHTSPRSRPGSLEEEKEQDVRSSSTKINNKSTTSDSVFASTSKTNQSDERNTGKELQEKNRAYFPSPEGSQPSRLLEASSSQEYIRDGRGDIPKAEKAIALFNCSPENSDDLPLIEGQVILVSYRHDGHWLIAQNPNTGKMGLVLRDGIRLLKDSNVEGQGELRRERKQKDEAEDRQLEGWMPLPKGAVVKDALQIIDSVATRPSESGSDSDTGSGLESWWDWDFPGSALADMKAQTIAILVARFNSDYGSFENFVGIQYDQQQAIGSQGSEPRPSTGSRHPSNATGWHSGKGKRKALHNDNRNEQDKDEEDDSDGDGRRRKRLFGVRTGIEDEERLLACPFYKKDPFRHRACARKVLKAVSRVKFHLLRCHQQPIHCDRCSKTFDCENDRKVHARMAVPCTVKPAVKWDAINDDQKQQLSRRSSSKQSERDQWFGIYAILFPDAETVPESPYLERLQSRVLRQMMTYAEVRGKGIVDELMLNLPENLWHVQLDIMAFLESATQEFISRLFEQWEAERQTPPSKGSDTMATSIPLEGPSVAAATATTTNVSEIQPDTQFFNTTQPLPLQPVTTVPATAVAPQLLDFDGSLEMVNSNVPWSAYNPLKDDRAHVGPENSEQWALNNTSHLGSSQFANLDSLPNMTTNWPELLSIMEPSSPREYDRMVAGKASQD
ncbi:MAG: hypothetical protein M1821_004076 [Bathelium mastoideum]|nr:MAG: hypothetical protein M1821_004076 [Bathelium mastoideum]KAI9691144.1 MAG: hypothetical protein M1822_008764 [Bathelium mastoideum]